MWSNPTCTRSSSKKIFNHQFASSTWTQLFRIHITGFKPIEVVHKTFLSYFFLICLYFLDAFVLDVSTGVLWCRKPLDREKVALYDLHISQTSRAGEDAVHVVVRVLDTNDNVPHFSSENLVFGVPLDAHYGYLVGTIEVILHTSCSSMRDTLYFVFFFTCTRCSIWMMAITVTWPLNCEGRTQLDFTSKTRISIAKEDSPLWTEGESPLLLWQLIEMARATPPQPMSM